MSGHYENVEALSYRCMWMWGDIQTMSHLMTRVDASVNCAKHWKEYINFDSNDRDIDEEDPYCNPSPRPICL